MIAEAGDKVRFKSEPHTGERGIVEDVCDGVLKVRVGGELIQVAADDVTNLSLAARKAWKSMPDRRVGRPVGSKVTDRVSVSLRIDRELWDALRQLERSGEIGNRTQVINEWLRRGLDELGMEAAANGEADE